MMRLPLRSKVLFISAMLIVSCAHVPVNFRDLQTGKEDEGILREGIIWLDQHPEDVDARIFVGNAAWRLGLHDQALEIWGVDEERILARDVYLGELLIQSSIDRGNLRKAERLLSVEPPETIPPDLLLARRQRLAKIRSDRIQAANAAQRGDEALLRGEFQRVLDFYKRAMELDPISGWEARLIAIRAWSLFQANGESAAGEITQMLTRALHLDSSPPVLFLDAMIQRELGNLNGYASDLEIMNRSFPDSPFTAKANGLE
ncbi:MAG: hypothetical protein V2A56_09680 [bacterium]